MRKKGDVVAQFESETIEQRYVNAVNEKGIAEAKAAQQGAQMAMDRLLQEAAKKGLSLQLRLRV